MSGCSALAAAEAAYRRAAAATAAARLALDEAELGLGRSVALHYTASPLYTRFTNILRVSIMKRQCDQILGGARRSRGAGRAQAVPKYALAASPFALLDARGSLRLITDVMHEDDALCLALTCRALREALWARFPRRPAGDAHAGARVCTQDAAVVGTLGRLVWARGLDRPWPELRAVGVCHGLHGRLKAGQKKHGLIVTKNYIGSVQVP
jgi:hypothetical protein